MATVEEDDNHSVSSLLYNFFGYTSMHGAGRIVASRHWTRKIFWSISIMATVVAVSLQVQTVYKLYVERPVSTRITLAHNTSLPFPAITICGMNALRDNEMKSLFSESLRREFEERLTNSSSGHEGHSWSMDPLEKLNKEDDEDDGDGEGHGSEEHMEVEFLDKEHLRAMIALEDPSVLRQIGHQFEDFVVYCTFRGVYCANYSSIFWSHFWHFAYGNCYVFNGGTKENGTDADILNSNVPGPVHGLSLELNIEDDQYIGALTQSAGVRIQISTQGEMPFPLDKGLSLAPGYETSIGMQKVVIKRLDPLSTNACRNHSAFAADETNIYSKMMNVKYSTIACKKSCWASSQRKLCGCIEYKFPRPADTPVCNTINKTVERCLKKVGFKYKKRQLNCSNSCPPPCRANVLKVDIFYEELNYEVISEELSYELANFISDLGGSLGLWIGMSVLTAAEIFELLLLMCLALVRKLKRGRNSKSSTVAVEMFAE